MITAFNKVQSCIFTLWNGKKVDFTSALSLPVLFNEVLDETLNTAKITLTDLRKQDYPDIDVSIAFEPYIEVSVVFTDKNRTKQKRSLDMLIAHDDCKMQRKDNGKWRSYEHAVQLVEKTKGLERLSVDTLIFTNPLMRKYDSEAYAEWSVESK